MDEKGTLWFLTSSFSSWNDRWKNSQNPVLSYSFAQQGKGEGRNTGNTILIRFYHQKKPENSEYIKNPSPPPAKATAQHLSPPSYSPPSHQTKPNNPPEISPTFFLPLSLLFLFFFFLSVFG
jgi:hypothetical protein